MSSRALSPSVAYGCVELLGAVSRNALTPSDVTSLSLGAVPSQDILSSALQLRWLEISETGHLSLTLKGSRAASTPNVRISLKLLLLDYIDAENPPWIQLAPSGRREVLLQAPKSLSQVFVDAGLAYGDDSDTVSFWDNLAARARGIRNAGLTETGRQGERLTLSYEKKRTGTEPKWIALDSNLDGYDVLSRVSDSDNRRLTIEVKTSTQSALSGFFYITRNEWSLAEESRFHTIHLWDLSGIQPQLAALTVEEVGTHIPANAGRGIWESVRIPFEAFKSAFIVPHLHH